MKAFSVDLLALLRSHVPVERIHLFAIGPCENGVTFYVTDGQLAVTVGGNVYQPALYGNWSRGSITTKIGLESNGTQLTVAADSQIPVYFPGTSNAELLLDGIKAGLIDDAPITIQALYNSRYLPGYAFPAVTGPTSGSLLEMKFVGLVTTIEPIGLTKAELGVQDLLYLLNQQVPSRVLQASCSHTLFDAGCELVGSAFTRTGAVASIMYPYQFVTSAHLAPISPAGTFTLGVLTWTSGKNAGLGYFVRGWMPGGLSDTIVLDLPPIFPIQVGDAFSITQGCDKTFVSCTDLQGATNADIRFGGQPDTPVPETAIGGGA